MFHAVIKRKRQGQQHEMKIIHRERTHGQNLFAAEGPEIPENAPALIAFRELGSMNP